MSQVVALPDLVQDGHQALEPCVHRLAVVGDVVQAPAHPALLALHVVQKEVEVQESQLAHFAVKRIPRIHSFNVGNLSNTLYRMECSESSECVRSIQGLRLGLEEENHHCTRREVDEVDRNVRTSLLARDLHQLAAVRVDVVLHEGGVPCQSVYGLLVLRELETRVQPQECFQHHLADSPLQGEGGGAVGGVLLLLSGRVRVGGLGEAGVSYQHDGVQRVGVVSGDGDHDFRHVVHVDLGEALGDHLGVEPVQLALDLEEPVGQLLLLVAAVEPLLAHHVHPVRDQLVVAAAASGGPGRHGNERGGRNRVERGVSLHDGLVVMRDVVEDGERGVPQGGGAGLVEERADRFPAECVDKRT